MIRIIALGLFIAFAAGFSVGVKIEDATCAAVARLPWLACLH